MINSLMRLHKQVKRLKPPVVMVIADPHIGPRAVQGGSIWNQSLIEERMFNSFFDVLTTDFIKDFASVKTLIVAGDIFDRPLIPPRVIKHILWSRRPSSATVESLVCVTGNHDVDKISGNALEYFTNAKGVHVVHEPTSFSTSSYGSLFLYVPYVPEYTALESLEQALAIRPAIAKTLVGHFGVYDHTSLPFVKADPQAIAVDVLQERLRGTSIKLVITGHYHKFMAWRHRDPHVVNIGALSPRNFGETGTCYGNAVFIGSDGRYVISTNLIPGVRYITEHRQLPKDENVTGNWLLLRDLEGVHVPGYMEVKEHDLVDALSTYNVFTHISTKQAAASFIGEYSEIGINGVSPQDAIGYYVKKNYPSFRGPKLLLAQDAVDRAISNGVTRAAIKSPHDISLLVPRNSGTKCI